MLVLVFKRVLQPLIKSALSGMRFLRPRTLVYVTGVIIFILFIRSSGRSGTLRRVVPNNVRLQRELEKEPEWKERGLYFQTVKTSRDPWLNRLQSQLSAEFPYEPEKGFAKNVWQTWKVGLDDETFPTDYNKFQESWNDINPDYRHYLISDPQCHAMVIRLFEKIPDVVEAWNSMPKSILKADFFRYLILFARGGVYSDIDTVSLKPISLWLSAKPTVYDKVNTAGLVVGIEADPDREDWSDWYARRIQFCQWTIQAKKGHPMLRDLIAKITEITLDRKRDGTLKSVTGKDSGGDIMNWTGPGIFTDLIFDYINAPFEDAAVSKDKDQPSVSWELFSGMKMPILIDDVLVLPITSFSPGVGQMGAGEISDEWAYVHHLFSGSWKG